MDSITDINGRFSTSYRAFGAFHWYALLVTSIHAWVPHAVPRRNPMHMIAPQQLGRFEALAVSKTEQRRVIWLDWTDGNLTDFNTAWDVQKFYLQQHLSRLDKAALNSLVSTSFLPDHIEEVEDEGLDRIIMLEHAPVYTLGTASDASFILENSTTIPVVRMDRGGEVTYHGPGQLTVYPVIDLKNYKQDIHWYVRALEESVLKAIEICLEKHGCKDGVKPIRDDSFTGVWVPNYGKVAAIGIKCRRWVTQHGVAINVERTCLPPFSGIIPCGLTGSKAQVSCINDLVKRPVTVSEMAQYMKEGMEQIFRIQLIKL